jgi:hypothetical protein
MNELKCLILVFTDDTFSDKLPRNSRNMVGWKISSTNKLTWMREDMGIKMQGWAARGEGAFNIYVSMKLLILRWNTVKIISISRDVVWWDHMVISANELHILRPETSHAPQRTHTDSSSILLRMSCVGTCLCILPSVVPSSFARRSFWHPSSIPPQWCYDHWQIY